MIDLWFFFLYFVWDLASSGSLLSCHLLCPAMGHPKLGWPLLLIPSPQLLSDQTPRGGNKTTSSGTPDQDGHAFGLQVLPTLPPALPAPRSPAPCPCGNSAPPAAATLALLLPLPCPLLGLTPGLQCWQFLSCVWRPGEGLLGRPCTLTGSLSFPWARNPRFLHASAGLQVMSTASPPLPSPLCVCCCVT